MPAKGLCYLERRGGFLAIAHPETTTSLNYLLTRQRLTPAAKAPPALSLWPRPC